MICYLYLIIYEVMAYFNGWIVILDKCWGWGEEKLFSRSLAYRMYKTVDPVSAIFGKMSNFFGSKKFWFCCWNPPPPKKNPLFIQIIKFKNILHVFLINYFKSSLILHNEVQYVLHVKYKFSSSFVGFCSGLSQAGDCRYNYIDTCVSERLVGQKKKTRYTSLLWNENLKST